MVNISEADMVAAELQNTGKSSYVGSLHSMSVRIPPHQVAQVEAIARRLGKSRNAAFTRVLSSGFDAICRSLSPEDAQKLIDEAASIQISYDGSGEL